MAASSSRRPVGRQAASLPLASARSAAASASLAGSRKRLRINGADPFFAAEDDDDGRTADQDDDVVGLETDTVAETETADEARVRLTRRLIASIGSQQRDAQADDVDDDDDEQDGEAALTRGLQAAASSLQGRRLSFSLSARLRLLSSQSPSRLRLRFHRGHRLSPTCLCLRSDDARCYSGSKDGSIIEWETETGRKLSVWSAAAQLLHGQQAGKAEAEAQTVSVRSAGGRDIASLALSSSGFHLVSGHCDGRIRLWDTRQRDRGAAGGDDGRSEGDGCLRPPAPALRWLYPAHRSAVSGLCFRHSSSQLFTGGADRTVKLFDVERCAYTETLFGHAAAVQAVHALHRDRAVSVGQDRTARLWKVQDETQLLFRAEQQQQLHSVSTPAPSVSASASASTAQAGSGLLTSLDCVSMLDDEHFLTGGDDGCVSYWSARRKRPLRCVQAAHGAGRWIVSLTSCPFSDAAFSGSHDGFINCYGCTETELSTICRIACVGFVNALCCSHSGRLLVAAVGTEHRAGRWLPEIRQARNGIAIVDLQQDRQEEEEGGQVEAATAASAS